MSATLVACGSLPDERSRSRESQIALTSAALRLRLDDWEKDSGTLEELVAAGRIDRRLARDAWGEWLIYCRHASTGCFFVMSLGGDGKPGPPRPDERAGDSKNRYDCDIVIRNCAGDIVMIQAPAVSSWQVLGEFAPDCLAKVHESRR